MSGYMVPEVHCDLCDAKEVAEDEGTLRGLREWLRQGRGWVRRRATDDDVPLVAPPTPWKVGDLIDVCLDCVRGGVVSARQVIGRVDGREVSVWNTAAAGRPSIERARSSVDEALAALAAYAEQQAERGEAS